MNNNIKNIDDLFKEELGSYTETPPPAVWSRLEERLGQPKAPRSYRRYWYFGILSLILLISVSAVWEMTGSSFSGYNKVAFNESAGGPAIQAKTGNTNGSLPDNSLPAGRATKQQAGNSQSSSGTAATDDNSKQQTDQNDNINNTTTKEQTINNDKEKKQNRSALAKTTNRKKSNSHFKNSKGHTAADQDELENVYSGSVGLKNKTAPGKTDEAVELKKPTEVLAMAPKKDAPIKPKAATPAKTVDKYIPKPKFNRFEAGIKAGYESGFDNDAAKKIIASPYIQYKISQKFAVMLQPAIKSAYLSSRRIGNPESYYKINNDSSVTIGTPHPVYETGGALLGYITQVNYKETHDSIVKSNYLARAYTEFELPVLLKYYVGKKFSVYGGVNIIYGKQPGVNEQTYTSGNLSIPDSVHVFSSTLQEATNPVHPSIRSLITYQGTPFSSYTGPRYPSSPGSLLRFGYMLGFSYEYGSRLLFDALIQQGTAKPNVQGGYDINTALSAPYFRLTIGYKVIR